MKKFILKNKKNILVSVLIGLSLFSENVYASTSNPGVEFGNWLQTNTQGAFNGIVAVVGLFLAVTRQVIRLVIAIVIASVASILVYGNQSFLIKIGSIVSGWF